MLRTRLAGDFAHVAGRGYATISVNRTQDFQAIYKELDDKLQRSRLNATHRNLAYRPRRARDLTSRRTPIIVDGGKTLEPTAWKGEPGKKELIRCIRLVSSAEEFQQTKQLMRDYHQYYPNHINASHATRLVRQAAIIGQYNDGVTFAKSDTLKGHLQDERVLKEWIRLHALRLGHTLRNKDKLETFLSLFPEDAAKMSLELKLLKVVGISQLNGDSSRFSTELAQSISDAQRAIENAAAVQTPNDIVPREETSSLYINLRLAVDVFSKHGYDTVPLQSLLKLTKTQSGYRSEAFFKHYVGQVEEGFEKERNSQVKADKSAAGTDKQSI